MINDKPFKSVSEQITLLRKRNLIISDEIDAAQKISANGYYEIINGYKETFLEKPDKFKNGTTFDDVFALYYFDAKVRSTIMESLGYFELFLKQQLSALLSEKYTEQFECYINPNVFNTGNKLFHPNSHNHIYTDRDALFRKCTKIKDYNYEPYLNYKNNHGNTPPWILFKGFSFGNLFTAIRLLNSTDKRLLVKRVFSSDLIDNIGEENADKAFFELIKLTHKYRNRAAHGGRIYNYIPQNTGITYQKYIFDTYSVSRSEFQKHQSSNIYNISILLSFLKPNFSYTIMKNGINNSINKYSDKWGDQTEYVLNSMGFPKNYNFK